MTKDFGEIGNLLSREITAAIEKLLSEKHLYQSVEISLSAIHEYITGTMDAKPSHKLVVFKSLTEIKNRATSSAWEFTQPLGILGLPQSSEEPGVLYFKSPTIRTLCPNEGCSGLWPFNPTSFSGLPTTPSTLVVTSDLDKSTQVFVCSYQCQSCKAEPLVFLIRRRGVKLTLAGRSRIENIPVPNVIPKLVREFYSDALIAHHSGKTLAALFYLRTAMEQFWHDLLRRRVIIVPGADPRIRADILAKAYNNILPEAFKGKFPSLGKIYDDISDRLHRAFADDNLFVSAAADIVEHFEARRLWKLDAEDAAREAPEVDQQAARHVGSEADPTCDEAAD